MKSKFLSVVLITAALSQPKGMNLFQSTDFLTKNGMNLFPYAQNWDEIETSPGQYALQGTVINPLTLLVPRYPLKGVLLVIKMIDTNTRTMPSDLQNKPFDDPEVRQRFLAMLHAIAQEPSTKKLTHILLGNEVDAYVSAHPKELNAFVGLLKESFDQLHRDLPGVKVGTITTFDALNHPQIFQRLIEYSDFVDYTYYPINGLSGGLFSKGWQMRPIADVATDLHAMAKAAGHKPFSFTEIGYSASSLNNSSEDKQAEFVQTVFDTLETYHQQNRIAFISWSSFSDMPPEFCNGYAYAQGIDNSKEFCAFLGNLGLRTYEDNRARKAWSIFVTNVGKWTK